MKRTDWLADLSSTDDGTLEVNKSECEELWDLIALLETFCEHYSSQENNVMQYFHLTTIQKTLTQHCQNKVYFFICSNKNKCQMFMVQ